MRECIGQAVVKQEPTKPKNGTEAPKKATERGERRASGLRWTTTDEQLHKKRSNKFSYMMRAHSCFAQFIFFCWLEHLLPSRAEDEVGLQLRRTIRLSECLDDGHNDFKVSLPDFKELLCQIFVPIQMYTPKLLDIKAHLPEEIYVQLDGLACASPNEREVHIYTDGSYTKRMPDLASWALVVFFDEGTTYPCH